MKKELKLGIFVVCVLTAAFFVLNYLRGKDIFNREIELVSEYENLEGLVASAPVYIKGYKAGKVTEVSYDSEKEAFAVKCSVSKEFRIPSDSRMTIYSVDIMGGKGVKIELGSSDRMASDGDTLAPCFEAGLMDGLSAGVGPLMQKITGMLDSLSVTVSGVNAILSESNRVSVERTLASLDRTMSELRSLASSVNGKSDELTAVVDDLAAFSSKLGGIADNVGSTVNGVNEVLGTINDSDISGVLTSLKSLLDSLQNPDGTVGSLLVNNSVYNSVDSLLNDINVLVDKIQENPRKYLKISVF